MKKLLVFIVALACINALDADPIHDAAQAGNIDEVRRLLEGGADPNITDDYNATPLHYAALGGHVDVITLLLEAGASPVAKDHEGKTPYDLATMYKHSKEILNLLEPMYKAARKPAKRYGTK